MTFIALRKERLYPATIRPFLCLRSSATSYWCYDAPTYTVCALCQAFPRADRGPATLWSVSATLSVGVSSSGNQWGIVC